MLNKCHFVRDEVIGGWIKQHNEVFHKVNFSPSIIKMIKPRTMKWAGHIALMGKKKTCRRKETTRKTEVGG
jgi:hypothetical protein